MKAELALSSARVCRENCVVVQKEVLLFSGVDIVTVPLEKNLVAKSVFKNEPFAR